MLKSEKEELIKELNEKFSRAQTAIVAEFTKLNVDTVTRLRRKFREAGVDYKVLKNTLAKRAAKGTALEPLADDFVGSVAVAIGYGDPITPAKVLQDFIKDLETIKVKAAVVDGKRIDAKGVMALSKMPGLQELRGTIAAMINTPATKLARMIAAPGSQLARVIQANADKNQ